MDPMRPSRYGQASGSGNVPAAGNTARKPRKKAKTPKTIVKGGPVPAPYLAVAPSPVSAMSQSRLDELSGIPSTSRSSMMLPSSSRPSPYARTGPSPGPSRPTDSPIRRKKYAAGLLAPPAIMPGGQASAPRVQGRTSPVPPANRRRSTERLNAVQQPIAIVSTADGGTAGEGRLGTRHRSSERLRELGQVNASMMSLGHLGRILETDPTDSVTAPNPSTSQDQPPTQTGRRRRTIVRRDGGLTRRPTVSTREEGRALGVARGASMRRTNVWDDLPESEDPPPAFPFPTASTNRLPPAFQSANPMMPPSLATDDGRSRSPPPTFEQAIGLHPLPAPLTPSDDPDEPPGLGAPESRPALTLDTTSPTAAASTSSPTSPTGTQWASAPSSPIRSEAGLPEIGEEDEEGEGTPIAMREDRRMWNADILAGYTLEERVRRESERRESAAAATETLDASLVVPEANGADQTSSTMKGSEPKKERTDSAASTSRNLMTQQSKSPQAVSTRLVGPVSSTPARQSPIQRDTPTSTTRTPKRRTKKGSTDSESTSTVRTRKSSAKAPTKAVEVNPDDKVGPPVNLEESTLGSKFVEAIADDPPVLTEPKRSFKVTSRPSTRTADHRAQDEESGKVTPMIPTEEDPKASLPSAAAEDSPQESSEVEIAKEAVESAKSRDQSVMRSVQRPTSTAALPLTSPDDNSPPLAAVPKTRMSQKEDLQRPDLGEKLVKPAQATLGEDSRSQSGSDRIISQSPPSRKLTRGKAVRRSSADKDSPVRANSIRSKVSADAHQKPLFSSPGYTAAELERLPNHSRVQNVHRLSAPTLPMATDKQGPLALRDRTKSQPNVLAHQEEKQESSGLPPHREAALRRRESALGRMERRTPKISTIASLLETKEEKVESPITPSDHLLIDLDDSWPSTYSSSPPQSLQTLAASTAELLQLLEDDSVAESSAQGAARAAAIRDVRASVGQTIQPVAPRKKPPPPPISKRRRSEVEDPIEQTVSDQQLNAETASIASASTIRAAEVPPALPARRAPPPPPPSAAVPSRIPPLPPRPETDTVRPSPLNHRESYVSTADSSISEQDPARPPTPVYRPRPRTSLAMRPRGPRPIPPPVPPRPWAKAITSEMTDSPADRPSHERSLSDTSLVIETSTTSPQRSMSVADLRSPVREARSPEYTDLDVYVSRLEGSGREYEGFAHLTSFLGPAKNPAASRAALETLFTALVQVDSRRTNAAGKVKLKLSLLGVRVTKCPICLSQFKDKDKAVMLPMCGHVGHEGCVRRWFREDRKCFVCREVLTEM